MAIKRSKLVLGMIPADGIGKEVLPVRCVDLTRSLSAVPTILDYLLRVVEDVEMVLSPGHVVPWMSVL